MPLNRRRPRSRKRLTPPTADNGAVNYVRVDWLNPQGLRTWGDGLNEALAASHDTGTANEFAARYRGAFSAAYRERGWQEVFGASGTIKAIGEICTEMKLTQNIITEAALKEVREQLLQFDKIDNIKLPGLPADRRPVIAGGLLILDAAFTELGIKRMHISDDALREGVLYDMIGRRSERDPREASIQALCSRYAVDMPQADRVEKTALKLFDDVAEDWLLDSEEFRLLGWAARLHEMGLAIAHSQYHTHGAYLIEHSDAAGFSKTEQQFMAALIRNQRRGFNNKSIQALPSRLAQSAQRCAILLRIAVLLHRGHERDP